MDSGLKFCQESEAHLDEQQEEIEELQHEVKVGCRWDFRDPKVDFNGISIEGFFRGERHVESLCLRQQ